VTLCARSLQCAASPHIFKTVQRGAAPRTAVSAGEGPRCRSRPAAECAPRLHAGPFSPLEDAPHTPRGSPNPEPDLRRPRRAAARSARRCVAGGRVDAHRKIALGASSPPISVARCPAELLRSAQRASLEPHHPRRDLLRPGERLTVAGRSARRRSPAPSTPASPGRWSATVVWATPSPPWWATVAPRAGCRDPVVRRALRIMASGPTRHAGLGWRFVAWSVGQRRERRGSSASPTGLVANAADLGEGARRAVRARAGCRATDA